jgi:pyruvate formate lyase activating enzyme
MQSNSDDLLPPIVHIHEIAEAGFPDIICPVIFLPACNLRCPYCLNAKIVKDPTSLPPIPFKDVLKQLEDWGEDMVLISGGEPCMNEGLPELARRLKAEGVEVRLSSNGTIPQMLNRLLLDDLVSFVAMDVKANLWAETDKSLAHVTGINNGDKNSQFKKNMLYSLTILKTHKEMNPEFEFEVRTTLYPPDVTVCDVADIAANIPRNASTYVLQHFRPRKNLLAKEATDVTTYSSDELDKILEVASANFHNVQVRYP